MSNFFSEAEIRLAKEYTGRRARDGAPGDGIAFTFYIKENLQKKYKELADKQNLTLNVFCICALNRYMANYEKDEYASMATEARGNEPLLKEVSDLQKRQSEVESKLDKIISLLGDKSKDQSAGQ